MRTPMRMRMALCWPLLEAATAVWLSTGPIPPGTRPMVSDVHSSASQRATSCSNHAIAHEGTWLKAFTAACCSVQWPAAAAEAFPLTAMVHAPANSLSGLMHRISSLPSNASLTLVVSGSDETSQLPFDLLADTRITRVFQLLAGSSSGTIAAAAAFGNVASGKQVVIQWRPGVAACTSWAESLEQVWASHEAQLLAHDPAGISLAHHYEQVLGLDYAPTGYGPYAFYTYANRRVRRSRSAQAKTVYYAVPYNETYAPHQSVNVTFYYMDTNYTYEVYCDAFVRGNYIVYECNVAHPDNSDSNPWTSGTAIALYIIAGLLVLCCCLMLAMKAQRLRKSEFTDYTYGTEYGSAEEPDGLPFSY